MNPPFGFFDVFNGISELSINLSYPENFKLDIFYYFPEFPPNLLNPSDECLKA